jgi:hypothetical protein
MLSAVTKSYQTVVWLGFRLPLTLILICVGFIFEFVVSLPFIAMCQIDTLSKK